MTASFMSAMSTRARNACWSRLAEASRSSATVSSAMHKFTLAQGPVKRGARLVTPARDLVRRKDENVGRNPQRSQKPPQAHHFSRAVLDQRLNHQEIDIGIVARIAAGMRAEKDDARGTSGLCQNAHR